MRQKTYIERVTHSDGEEVKPYYNITCAGMPKRCKNLLSISMNGEEIKDEDFTKEQLLFLYDENHERIKRGIEDFKVGLEIPGKLLPKRIPGGIILLDTSYKIRG